MEEICFNRMVGICKERCPRDYIANGHNYHCPPDLKYVKEEIPPIEKTIRTINQLERMTKNQNAMDRKIQA